LELSAPACTAFVVLQGFGDLGFRSIAARAAGIDRAREIVRMNLACIDHVPFASGRRWLLCDLSRDMKQKVHPSISHSYDAVVRLPKTRLSG